MGWEYTEKEYDEVKVISSCTNEECLAEYEGEADARHGVAYWECPVCFKSNESLVDCE